MQIQFWQIGKSEMGFESRINEYKKWINAYCVCDIQYFSPSKKSAIPEVMKKVEAEYIISRLKDSDYLILLDESGKEMTSRNFSSFIEKCLVNPTKRIIFLCGGAYGFDPLLYKRAKSAVSLSKMTFSHQLIGLIFMEQLFRAFTIINNHPYHND